MQDTHLSPAQTIQESFTENSAKRMPDGVPGISRSTLAGWLRDPPPDVVTAGVLETNICSKGATGSIECTFALLSMELSGIERPRLGHEDEDAREALRCPNCLGAAASGPCACARAELGGIRLPDIATKTRLLRAIASAR
jgi:hypothetical protein